MPEQQDTWNLAGNSLDKHNYVVQKTSPPKQSVTHWNHLCILISIKGNTSEANKHHMVKNWLFSILKTQESKVLNLVLRFSTFLHVLSVSHVQLNHLLFLTAVLVFDVPISFFLYWFTSVSKRTSSLFWNFLFAGLPFCNRINTYNYNR